MEIRGGTVTAPADAACIASTITSMQCDIGNSWRTSAALMILSVIVQVLRHERETKSQFDIPTIVTAARNANALKGRCRE